MIIIPTEVSLGFPIISYRGNVRAFVKSHGQRKGNGFARLDILIIRPLMGELHLVPINLVPFPWFIGNALVVPKAHLLERKNKSGLQLVGVLQDITTVHLPARDIIGQYSHYFNGCPVKIIGFAKCKLRITLYPFRENGIITIRIDIPSKRCRDSASVWVAGVLGRKGRVINIFYRAIILVYHIEMQKFRLRESFCIIISL